MINKWFQADRNKQTRDRSQTAARRDFGEFEKLEDKRVLAFLGFFDGVSLDLTQITDDGDVVLDNTGGQWTVTDNSGAKPFFVNPTNISIELLDDTANSLTVLVEAAHPGNLEMILGNGVREVVMDGMLNEIDGDLIVTGGINTQEVTLTGDNGLPLIVHGSIDIDLGDDFDFVLSNAQLVTVDVDVFLTGVNHYEYSLMAGLFGPPPTDGDVFIDVSGEDVESFLIPDGGMFLVGGFNYLGNVNIDRLDLTGATITEDVNIDLGLGDPFFGDPQLVELLAAVGGDINIAADDSNLGNEINLGGTFLGNIVSYTGGDLVDSVVYDIDAPQADVLVTLGGGDDTFELNMPVNLLEVDFGNDTGDLFTNNLVGLIDFEYDITNYHFFDFFYTALDDTLRVNQLADMGDVTVDNGSGPSMLDWRFQSALAAGEAIVPIAQNMFLTMVPNTGNNLEIDLVNAVDSTTLVLGDGARTVQYTGLINNVLRDVDIRAGAGDQVVDLSVNAPLGVATLEIDLGSGFDTVNDNANSLIINEDMRFTGVNDFMHSGLLSVFRDATIDNSVDTVDSVFAGNGSLFVGGEFHYTGSDGADDVRVNGAGGVQIVEDATINLGGNNGAGPQFASLDGASTVDIGGNLNVSSTGISGTDTYTSNLDTSVGGNIDISLGGGTNTAIIVGTLGGSLVNYTGLDGIDNVIFGTTGTPADVTILLDGGNDTFTLLAGASIDPTTLYVDFGNDNDSFFNLYGVFDFNAILLGLAGFDHDYNFITSTLTSTQLSDVGDLTIDNNGTGDSFQFINGGTVEVAPAANLAVTLLDGTSMLDVDLDNAHTGDLTIDVGNGDRAVNFTGTSNSIGGNLHLTADTGSQVVELAVNADLGVGGHANIDLGADADVVDEDNNNISITGDLDLVGVNFFENGGTMNVGGNVLVDNSGESLLSFFDDDATMSIIGSFTYLGGSGADQVTMNGLASTSIGGNALVNLGDNAGIANQVAWFDAAGSSVAGSLTVTSTAATNIDNFVGNSAATFGGDIDIDLGDGNNDANIIGVFGGDDVTYNGGSGTDSVTFGTTGNPADVFINLYGDDDSFTLLAGASIDPTTLEVDFGTGDDTFINLYGNFDFNA
ncbi:MAG: beta strand repeat-containing protein, partial [Pirellulaceae bacterium]